MRKMLMSFFVLLCLLSTVITYDYWDKTVEDEQFTEVVALSQKSTVTKISTPSGKSLVPKGTILGTNDVDEIEISYLVETSENTELNVFIEDVFIQKNEYRFTDEEDSLSFDFNIEQINEFQAEVKIIVNLNMPKNKDHYELIKDSSISFKVVFNQEII